MLKRTGIVLMATVGVALSTASASAATVSQFTFSGAQASGSWVSSTAVTCADPNAPGGYAVAYGYVGGAEQIYSTGYSGNGTYVEIAFYYNSCTGVNASGTGSVSGGFIGPDKKLESAGLTGSSTFQNYNDGSQIPLTLNLQIVGTGPTSTSKSSSQSKTSATKGGPVYISHDHSANTNRSGEFSGSITIDGVTFTNLQTWYASLNANGSANVTISK